MNPRERSIVNPRRWFNSFDDYSTRVICGATFIHINNARDPNPALVETVVIWGVYLLRNENSFFEIRLRSCLFAIINHKSVPNYVCESSHTYALVFKSLRIAY